MRHWWESHFGLLWKHFFERVLLPLTGLQKCNQQSYVLARRVVVLWSMRSNSSILQFPKQKSWKEGVKLKKKIFRLVDFDASFLLKKLSPWTNFPSCFLHWTNFPIHNSTRRRWPPRSSWSLFCMLKAKVVMERNVFSFWNLFAFAASSSFDVDVALSCIGFSQHQRLFFKSCFSGKYVPSFSKQILVIKSLWFLSSSQPKSNLIGTSTYLSFTLHKVCFGILKQVLQDVQMKKHRMFDLIRHQGGTTVYLA